MNENDNYPLAWTSLEAWESIPDRIKAARDREVYALIAHRGNWGATSDEVEEETGMPHQTASAITTKLRKRGFVRRLKFQESTDARFKDVTRRTRQGRRAWVLVVNRPYIKDLIYGLDT